MFWLRYFAWLTDLSGSGQRLGLRRDSCRLTRKPVQHCPDASDLDERLRGLHLELAVLRGAAMPAERALNDPVQADDLEGWLASFDDHEAPAFVALDRGGRLS